MMKDSSEQSRGSKLLVEGVEYDLSNLLTGDQANVNAAVKSEDLNGSSTSFNSSESESNYSGYLTCQSRGTMSRNMSNASSIFDQQSQARRESPYRFDVDAMRTLMTSFRGIPELKDSFRLSRTGQVLEYDDPSERISSTRRGGDATKDNEQELEEVPERCSLSTTDESQSQSTCSHNEEEGEEQSKPSAFHDSAINDLVYDETSGTYVYKDECNNNNEYHEARQTSQELEQEHDYATANRYTLEAMTASAQVDDGAFDDEEHEMEISPGHYVPFRGAKETWHAVATHCTVELECFDCSSQLVCINDCEFTVCPDCRVVNPVFCDNPIGTPFGVGMAFKKEWVLKKQMLQREHGALLIRQASRRINGNSLELSSMD